MKTKDLFRRLPDTARVLLIRLRSLGDCLLLTGPVRALKQEFPHHRISVLVESRFAAAFHGNPDFDEIISLNNKWSSLQLLGRPFDAIVNLHGGSTSLLYALMARGKRIGAEQYRYSSFYSGLVPPPKGGLHSVESTMATFRWLGVESAESPPLRYENHASEAERMSRGLKGGPYAVIHPGSAFATKRWDADRFSAIAGTLQANGLQVVVTSGPGEEQIAAQAARGTSSPTIMLGLRLPELAELIRGARLYVGNDSGPMHLAAAVGTPTIAIWGSSDSGRWRPWRVEHRVVQNPFECNPCPGYRCLVADTPLCIESVTTGQVVAAIEDILCNPR